MDISRDKLEKISNWWEGKNKGRPLFMKVLPNPSPAGDKPVRIDWEREIRDSDLDSYVRNASRFNSLYPGESYPVYHHTWGQRGTPMTMSSYLGGRVVFRDNTVWIDPVVDKWEDFRIRFDRKNRWVDVSRRLMDKQLELSAGRYPVSLPDLGDALTCMSMLRGTGQMLFDVVEKPDLVLEKVKEFTDAWKEAHDYFHSMYRRSLEGDCSWLMWAPGRTYACQCDFSTMISPSLFEKFVIFELEQLKDYLGYIIWHLDGYEEVRHLDILLGLRYIKAFQVVPGAGNPPCASETWLPVIKRITDAGKSVYVYAGTPPEVETLSKELPPERLFIDGGIPGSTIEETGSFVKRLWG